MQRLLVLAQTGAASHLKMKWEVTIAEFEENGRKKYKVTRRIPELSIAETKIFESKNEAQRQFEEWLS